MSTQQSNQSFNGMREGWCALGLGWWVGWCATLGSGWWVGL